MKHSDKNNLFVFSINYHSFRTVALNLFGFSLEREENEVAAIAMGAIVLAQSTPADQELSGERRSCDYQITPCYPSTHLLEENTLNSRAPKETSV